MNLALFLFLGCFISLSAEATIRIAAYDPKPPTEMLARRMGTDPGVIMDPPRPPRHASKARERELRTPSSKRMQPIPREFLPAPSLPNNEEEEKKSENIEFIVGGDLGPPLFLLGEEDLKNPHRNQEQQTLEAVGPPVIKATINTDFGGVIQPPAIRPPSPPGTGFSTGSMEAGPKPPSPPIQPPSPPTIMAGPPTAPQPAMTPSPPPPPQESKITDIKCLDIGGYESFEATLALPEGYEAVPVFEDRPRLDPTINPNCRMIPTQLIGMFQLIVSKFEPCGVRRCRQSNGETWYCLILRFPRLNGLKLPEDEIIEIRCRPHDRTSEDIHVLSVATAKYADKSGILTTKPPTVFEGLQEFECEIGLFRQLPGTQQFNTRVRDEMPLELGEKVQLWSIVKEGDGWEHSRLSEIVIQKEDGNKERSIQNTAVLVFSDGCRNPDYKLIADKHPMKDPSNSLINKFTFRAFMFQDMQPGDSLLISAKVLGCVLKEDCQPAECPDDKRLGFGRRRKRDTDEAKELEYSTRLTPVPPLEHEGLTHFEGYRQSNQTLKNRNVTGWSRNLAIKIKMPDESIEQKSIGVRDCKLYLFISMGISLLFCTIAIAFVSFVTFRNKKKGSELSELFPKKRPNEQQKIIVQEMLLPISNSVQPTTIPPQFSMTSSDLQKLPIPPTIRKRKKELNQELISMFSSENKYEYGTNFQPLFNYYGYMVVPRPQTSYCKSPRKVKRRGSISYPKNSHKLKNNKNNDIKEERECSCQKHQQTTKNERSDANTNPNHKSIIHISSQESVGGTSVNLRPKPRTRKSLQEHIYNEIHEKTVPTYV